MNAATRLHPLFTRYRALASELPVVSLGDFPTPVDAFPRWASELGCTSMTVKRDDLSAADYGGNKIRKLEFLLGDALAKGCDTVITFGGLGSNHALATSINCKRFGLTCVTILTPEPVTVSVRRTLAYHLALGTRVELIADYTDIRKIAARVQQETGPERCYEIPFGGSSWVGATGFVDAALELAEQVAAGAAPAPDVIYLPCGTAGSVAGLALGLQLGGLHARVEGVQVTPDSLQPAQLAERLAGEMMTELHARDAGFPLLDEPLAQLNVRNDQLGEGYAMPTAAAREANAAFTAATGLPASLTYTAKALAGMLADARAGQLQGRHVLFWNTYNSHPYPDTGTPDWSRLPARLADLLQ